MNSERPELLRFSKNLSTWMLKPCLRSMWISTTWRMKPRPHESAPYYGCRSRHQLFPLSKEGLLFGTLGALAVPEIVEQEILRRCNRIADSRLRNASCTR